MKFDEEDPRPTSSNGAYIRNVQGEWNVDNMTMYLSATIIDAIRGIIPSSGSQSNDEPA